MSTINKNTENFIINNSNVNNNYLYISNFMGCCYGISSEVNIKYNNRTETIFKLILRTFIQRLQ